MPTHVRGMPAEHRRGAAGLRWASRSSLQVVAVPSPFQHPETMRFPQLGFFAERHPFVFPAKPRFWQEMWICPHPATSPQDGGNGRGDSADTAEGPFSFPFPFLFPFPHPSRLPSLQGLQAALISEPDTGKKKATSWVWRATPAWSAPGES